MAKNGVSSMEGNQTMLSILMFPWLGHGHVAPYLQLAKNLSKRNFKIYFCSTPVSLDPVRGALARSSDGATIHLVELHLPSSPEFPPEYHTTKNIPPNLIPKLIEAFNQSKSSFSTILSSLKPDMVIYDRFQTWAATASSSLGIPAINFTPGGVFVHAYFYHHWRNSPFPYDALHLQDDEERPSENKVVSKIIQEDDQNRGSAHFKLSQDIILVMTSRSFEGKYMDYLSVLLQKTIVSVGPLIARATDEDDDSGILQWLSSKSRFSTVFISCGTENYFSKDQMQEVAKGLEISKVNFIWVVRFPLGERVSLDEMLPKGFLDRVGERGRIVQGWAPQDDILAHPSIGAFASHCGWNSTLESIHFGVPVISIPFKLDQPLNARLLVEAGVAVKVVRDGSGCFSSQEFANAIKKVIVEKTGQEMREKAAELSEKMKNEDEGVLNEVAEQLRKICMEHKQKRSSNTFSNNI
ncbi:beta-D-glucosyl crocetin beta-1,6-glucosyltransferase [Salvia divinorum]|uniref:Beta-D-glucosyl crocetin beta-1,6-glucosyltransferase n=1 Tax=Salvia divinorum TaxID=28513 RepID=A0ABD1GGP5_SALDI